MPLLQKFPLVLLQAFRVVITWWVFYRPMYQKLGPRAAPQGDGVAYEKWGLLRSLQITDCLPSEGVVRVWSPPLCCFLVLPNHMLQSWCTTVFVMDGPSRTMNQNKPFFLKKQLDLLNLCVCGFCLQVCMWTMCMAWCPWRSEKGIRPPGNGVTDYHLSAENWIWDLYKNRQSSEQHPTPPQAFFFY